MSQAAVSRFGPQCHLSLARVRSVGHDKLKVMAEGRYDVVVVRVHDVTSIPLLARDLADVSQVSGPRVEIALQHGRFVVHRDLGFDDAQRAADGLRSFGIDIDVVPAEGSRDFVLEDLHVDQSRPQGRVRAISDRPFPGEGFDRKRGPERPSVEQKGAAPAPPSFLSVFGPEDEPDLDALFVENDDAPTNDFPVRPDTQKFGLSPGAYHAQPRESTSVSTGPLHVVSSQPRSDADRLMTAKGRPSSAFEGPKVASSSLDEADTTAQIEDARFFGPEREVSERAIPPFVLSSPTTPARGPLGDPLTAGLFGMALGAVLGIVLGFVAERRFEARLMQLETHLAESLSAPEQVQMGMLRTPAAIEADLEETYRRAQMWFLVSMLSCALPCGAALGWHASLRLRASVEDDMF